MHRLGDVCADLAGFAHHRGSGPGAGSNSTLAEAAIRPRLHFITLGVDDLPRALAFYRDGLGLATPGIVGTDIEHGAVVFFELQPGLRLALWPRDSLAHDVGLAKTPASATEFALAHNVGSAAEVDALLAQAAAAGGRLLRPGRATAWGGYNGYFQDPDGHLWEVAWNPAIAVDD